MAMPVAQSNSNYLNKIITKLTQTNTCLLYSIYQSYTHHVLMVCLSVRIYFGCLIKNTYEK